MNSKLLLAFLSHPKRAQDGQERVSGRLVQCPSDLDNSGGGLHCWRELLRIAALPGPGGAKSGCQTAEI